VPPWLQWVKEGVPLGQGPPSEPELTRRVRWQRVLPAIPGGQLHPRGEGAADPGGRQGRRCPFAEWILKAGIGQLGQVSKGSR